MVKKKTVAIIRLISVIALSIGLLTKVYFTVERVFDDKPPIPKITIGSTYINVKLGSHCWAGCVDTIGPPELLAGVEPTIVPPNNELSIVFDYQQPSKIFVKRLVDGQWIDDQVRNGTFLTPEKPGVYFYSIFANWLNNHGYTRGDAAYALVIEVK